MQFEWDPEEAQLNRRKHKVSFEEAVTVDNRDDLRPEYDFDYSKAVRGKYCRRLLREGDWYGDPQETP